MHSFSPSRAIRRLFLGFCLLFLGRAALPAGEQPKSVVFKNFTAPPPSFLRNRNNITSELWQGFQLLRDANAGDPAAEHELGLRYLLGEGFPADTTLAAEWIRKACDQKLAVACYNYGVLLNNGMGVPWNPFEAYRQFQYAAARRIPQASYMLGIFSSDNLALPRNIPAAYGFFKAAADSGFEPAREVLAEFAERGWRQPEDPAASHGPALSPVIDTLALSASTGTIYDSIAVDRIPDSLPSPTLEKLRREMLRNGATPSGAPIGAEALAQARRAAAWGSPEALTFLGRCAEEGSVVPRDSIAATVAYLKAMRLNAPYAPLLLYRLIRGDKYFTRLKEEVDRRNPVAEYCWAALFAFGFGPPLTEQQALRLLESAAARSNVDAILALAACYHSGTWVRRDDEKERRLLGRAIAMQSREAALQLLLGRLMRKTPAADDRALLLEASDSGSVLAQEMLGYCYETGLLTGQSQPEAVKYYRLAAQRGNTSAFDALRRMYDGLRPRGKEFALPR
jgi:TPR repeat protein